MHASDYERIDLAAAERQCTLSYGTGLAGCRGLGCPFPRSYPIKGPNANADRTVEREADRSRHRDRTLRGYSHRQWNAIRRRQPRGPDPYDDGFDQLRSGDDFGDDFEDHPIITLVREDEDPHVELDHLIQQAGLWDVYSIGGIPGLADLFGWTEKQFVAMVAYHNFVKSRRSERMVADALGVEQPAIQQRLDAARKKSAAWLAQDDKTRAEQVAIWLRRCDKAEGSKAA